MTPPSGGGYSWGYHGNYIERLDRKRDEVRRRFREYVRAEFREMQKVEQDEHQNNQPHD